MSEPESHALTVFSTALERESGTDRNDYLDRACAGNPGLRERVDALLRAHERAGDFLESERAPAPVFDQATSAAGPPVGMATMELAKADLGVETRIGPYRLLDSIGEGGMGTVFLAEQKAPVRRMVAVKVIKPGMDSRQVIARFEAERQALALMDHPNIAKVLDAGTTDQGRPFFVMELVKGAPITRYCDEHRLTPRQRLELFLPICAAVQHAHQKGVIHRDLKPTNVLVGVYDGKPIPKVIDFGVAKAVGEKLTEQTLYTGYGAVIGTPEYMSPEQALLDNVDIDTRSDIYSLGILLYELLTGTTPLQHKRVQQAAVLEVLRLIREEEPPKPSSRLSTTDELPSVAANRNTEPRRLTGLVNGDLDWIVMKALDKDRNRRYDTANGLAADIQGYLNDEPVAACPPSVGYRFRKFARRNKTSLAFAALVLVILLTVMGGIGWTVRDRAARQTAVELEVKMALNEAEDWQEKGMWPDALSAAKRAEGLLARSGSDELRERVQQFRRDLDMVLRLDAIRLLSSELKGATFDFEGADLAYAQAFADYGIDVASLPIEEAAERIRAHEGVAAALANALDSWAYVRRPKDRNSSLALTELAQAADFDPWRRQVREAVRRNRVKSLESLAAAPEVSRQPPASLMTLANALGAVGLKDARIDFLRKSQQQFPGDFWINLSLGNDLANSVHSDESISFYRAAIAVRPQSAAAHYNLAYVLTGDEAIACSRKAIELNPKYARAHCNLGIDLMALGRVDEAIASFRDTLAIEPNHVLANYNLGSALRIQKRFPEALVHLRRAAELAPKWGMAHHELGNALFVQGNLEEAVGSYRKAIELDPASAQAQFALAGALENQGKVDDAIACLHKAIELDPKHAKALNNLGNILSDLNRHEEAIAYFQRAIEQDPELAQPRLNLGNELRRQGRLDAAIDSYRKVIELEPKNVPAQIGLGTALWEQGKFAEAATAYREAVKLDPDNANAHTGFGFVLREQGKLNEAVTSFERAIELDANLADAHAHLGWAFYLQGKLDKAVACYREALRLEPGRVATHTDFGRALSRMQQPELALASYRKAASLDPQNAAAHYYLAWELTVCAERKLRDPEQALNSAQRAVQLQPNKGLYWQGLGYAEYRAGNWNSAIAAFEKVKELGSPGDSVEWFPLAMAHWQLGEKDAAREKYEQAVEWMNANKPGDEFLRGLQVEAAELLGIARENK